MFNWVILKTFYTFLVKLWIAHFWEYRRIFLHWMTCFDEIDLLGGLSIYLLYFSSLIP